MIPGVKFSATGGQCLAQHKAHAVRITAHRACAQARAKGLVALPIPTEPNISVVDRAEVATFLESILLLLKSIGVDFFVPVAVTGVKTAGEDVYAMKYKDAEAKMVIKDGKYILVQGSTVVSKEAPAAKEPIKVKRKFFLNAGLASVIDDKTWIINQNLEFDSASYAASIVAGLGVNGLVTWKLHGKTLKEIELAKAESTGA